MAEVGVWRERRPAQWRVRLMGLLGFTIESYRAVDAAGRTGHAWRWRWRR